MCATVKKTDSKTVRAMMQQVADAGQKDAQLYLLRADAKAAGLMLSSEANPTQPKPNLTAEERAKRESIMSSLQALAYTGHREALTTLAEAKMRTATDQNGYATSFAMSLISYLDWSKPLPASEADEVMAYVPQELRSAVLLRMQELYRECCATAPNKDRYTAALDALGPPPPEPTLQASAEPNAGNLTDIFQVQRN